MKIERFIAARYLRSRKSNRLLSFISAVSVIGLALGVATLIVVINVMTGFSDNLQQKILGANSHVIVTRLDNSPIRDYNAVASVISQVDGVDGVSPFMVNQVLLSTDLNVSGVVVRGVVPSREATVSRLADFMTEGKLTDLNRGDNETPAIVLGTELAANLGVLTGDELVMISPFGKKGPFGFQPKMERFFVAGVFDTGMYEYNQTLAYIHISSAQEFFGTGPVATGFSVNTVEFDRAEDIAAAVGDTLGYPYWARDWLSMNQSLFSALKLEKFAMFVILTLIIIVASFNVISMISVTVKDKKRDIAILRAMGMPERGIKKIFMRQGLIIGLTGTMAGNALGLGISWVLSHYKLIELPEDIYYMDRIPVKLVPEVFIVVTVAALIITWVAALFPAGQSAKMDPIDAIRNE